MGQSKIWKLHVDERCEYRLRRGMPWLFAKYCAFDGTPETGERVAVYGKRNKCLGIGLCDMHSPIRVRLLGERCEFGDAYIVEKLNCAIASRIEMGIAASGETTGIRVLSGESEGLPGIVIDSYGGTWVVKIYTAIWLPYMQALISGLCDFVGDARQDVFSACGCATHRMILRFGRECRSLYESAGFLEGMRIAGDDETPYADFLENGTHLRAQVFRGQKTGFFLDQRENRQRVRALSRDKRVLDICCYSGGFSIQAARGGASEVWSLDGDKHALELVSEHFRLNSADESVAKCTSVLEKSNMYEWLERAKRRGQKFDLIIADPPSFASSQAQIKTAENAYMRLFSMAADCLTPRGQILCCSCSSHIGAEKFESIVSRALKHRTVDAVDYTGLPPDHVARFAEARYLKAWLLTIK